MSFRTFPHAVISYGTEPDPSFRPDYKPQQMIQMGIFGDAYFGDDLGISRSKMLPADWVFTKSGRRYTDTRGAQCLTINHFKRRASETRDWWMEKSLISDIDPLGWFEWYCHYWLGRRVSQYDDWQIQRWRSFRERHLRMYMSTRYPGSAQALLHWGIRAGCPLDELL